MGKHTPGPWSTPHFAESGVKCDCRYVLSEGYCGAIAEVYVNNSLPITEGGNGSPPLEEAQANAWLIAAAPELLKELEEMVGNGGALMFASKKDEEDYKRRRALIAKAKGQTPNG